MGVAFTVLVSVMIHQGLHQWGVDNSDFSRLANAIDTEISLVDRNGAIREGVLTEYTTDAVTMTLGSQTRVIPRPDVVSAERIHDRRTDGPAKGAIVGFIVGLVARQFADSPGKGWAHWVGWTGIGAGVGWMLDASQDHREALYESWTMPRPGVKVTLQF